MQRLFKTLSFIWYHPLNQRGKIAAFKRYLRWQLGPGIIKGNFVYPWSVSFMLINQRSPPYFF